MSDPTSLERPEIPIEIEEIAFLLPFRFFKLHADFGSAVISLDGNGWMGISFIEVEKEHRRDGIGKALLRKALELSEEVGAISISASIRSREAIDIFQKVFGEEHITIDKLGTFAPEDKPSRHDAIAYLNYEPQKPDII